MIPTGILICSLSSVVKILEVTSPCTISVCDKILVPLAEQCSTELVFFLTFEIVSSSSSAKSSQCSVTRRNQSEALTQQREMK